jgi:hypothetical protein
MSASDDYVDQTGGSFDVDSLKKKHRRRETAAKPRNALAAIEREILEEIASQSGRYGDRLDALLAEMQTLRRTIEEAMAQGARHGVSVVRSIAEVNARITTYNQRRRQAQQVQHYLIIHREAMGFWHHDDVFRCYPIPAALTPWSTPQIPALPDHS